MFATLAPLTVGPVQIGTVVTIGDASVALMVCILVFVVVGLVVWGPK